MSLWALGSAEPPGNRRERASQPLASVGAGQTADCLRNAVRVQKRAAGGRAPGHEQGTLASGAVHAAGTLACRCQPLVAAAGVMHLCSPIHPASLTTSLTMCEPVGARAPQRLRLWGSGQAGATQRSYVVMDLSCHSMRGCCGGGIMPLIVVQSGISHACDTVASRRSPAARSAVLTGTRAAARALSSSGRIRAPANCTAAPASPSPAHNPRPVSRSMGKQRAAGGAAPPALHATRHAPTMQPLIAASLQPFTLCCTCWSTGSRLHAEPRHLPTTPRPTGPCGASRAAPACREGLHCWSGRPPATGMGAAGPDAGTCHHRPGGAPSPTSCNSRRWVLAP